MATRIKRLLGELIALLLKLIGIEALTKEQTEVLLKPYQIASYPENHILLPEVTNEVDPSKVVFKQAEVITHPAYVWDYVNTDQKASLLPYGSVLVNRQILCTNFGNHHLLENLLTWRNRKPYSAQTVLVPWSHYIDGVAFGGYYDFVLLVAAELCRLKDALPQEVLSQTIVSYPLFNTAYEQEFLALIGFSENQIVDSRQYAVKAERFILGNNGHWFYPNVADILSLKRHVEAQLKPKKREYNRIYVSRTGRRRISNEDELLELVKKYQFIYIEDRPRTVAEQVEIYKNASFIMGPHGASFTNIIWCEPGTHLFELFSPNYVSTHFQYVAAVMQMNYSGYYQGLTEDNQYSQLEEDIHVSVAEVEEYLTRLLGTLETSG